MFGSRFNVPLAMETVDQAVGDFMLCDRRLSFRAVVPCAIAGGRFQQARPGNIGRRDFRLGRHSDFPMGNHSTCHSLHSAQAAKTCYQVRIIEFSSVQILIN